jgi:hypothetical protein
MKKRNKPAFYLVPVAQVEAFRSLLCSMQAALDEVFEEPYLPANVYHDQVKPAEAEFRKQALELINTPLNLDEIF